MTEKYIQLKKDQTNFKFLPTGDIFEAYHHDVMINQVKSNPIDGSMNNIFLRVYKGEKIEAVYPLLGVKATSEISHNEDQIRFSGEVSGIKYEVIFSLATENVWFWDVRLDGTDQTIDVVYGQDLGLAFTGALQANEAYMAQYVDYEVFETAGNYTVAARQNQVQGKLNPYVEQGSLSGAVAYSTDGYQFFGKEYKVTDQPIALTTGDLANEVYQYEFAYTALQTPKYSLEKDAVVEVNFYGLIKENHPEAIRGLAFTQELANAREALTSKPTADFETATVLRLAQTFSTTPLVGAELTETELNQLYPERQGEELVDGQLGSFFTPTKEHVVLQNKEVAMERSHGHILMSGLNTSTKQETLTSTSYMFGLFQAQIVLGNTSMNKLSTNARNALNFFKTSGQRIYVKTDEGFQLLTMPSVYELGFNYAKWIYKLTDDVIVVTVYTATDQPEMRLTVESTTKKSYEFLVTNQIIMNDTEYVHPYQVTENEGTYTFTADSASVINGQYPELSYQLSTAGAQVRTFDEAEFYEGVTGATDYTSLFSLLTNPTSQFSMSITASLEGNQVAPSTEDFETAVIRYRDYLADLLNGFQLKSETADELELMRLNVSSAWYTHNMLVHYLVPHGLEQYGGAAWGTRDVCQGPAEFFLVNQKYDIVKEIICTIYSHQFIENGNWPQWFMFDKYEATMAGESHGDVIVWPIKLIGDYLEQTGDLSILDIELPYMSLEKKATVGPKVPLLDHVKHAVRYIQDNFLPGTYLSSYGDGDWDDTLQPYDQKLKEDMASTWTVSLTYQTLKRFSRVIQPVDGAWSEELAELTELIGADFRKYMMKTDILPGFVLMHENNQPEYIVHPDDTKTGIDYRLLPMTRSMISELLSKEEMENHLKVINDVLLMPDGVHLMSQPANYDGGVSTYFKRAEQAANFGREVGLQYVHAHIRFVEAMAKIGDSEAAWKALQTINPILIQERVPNAEIRQSNAYFSSSDGKFNTRYEAGEHFDELRTGSRAVKGGWRIYSSGPGIYLNQLIGNVLGLRVEKQQLIIDPMVDQKVGDLELTYQYNQLPVTLRYHFGQAESGIAVNGVTLNVDELERTNNRYREGGYILSKDLVMELVGQGETIEIDYYQK